MEIVNHTIQFFTSYWYAILTIIGTTVIVPILLVWQLIIRRNENKMVHYKELSVVVDRLQSKEFEEMHKYFQHCASGKEYTFPMYILRKYLLEFERIYELIEKNVIKIDEVCKQFNYELRLMDDDDTIKMYNEMKGSNIGDYKFYGLKHLIDYNKSFKDKKNSKNFISRLFKRA